MMSYLASIQENLRCTRHNVSSVLSLIKTTVRSAYVADEASLYTDWIVRFFFSLCYLPPIALVLAVTHSSLQRIVWVLVVPVTQEMKKTPYDTSHVWTLMRGLGRISMKIAPFATLGISIATVGHKLINTFAEAMIDSHISQDGKSYPLLRARLMFIVQKKSRSNLFFLALTFVIAFASWGLYSTSIIRWTQQDADVMRAAGFIILAQILFVVLTVVKGAPQEVLDHSVMRRLYSGRMSPHVNGLIRKQRSTSSPHGGSEHHVSDPSLVSYFNDDWWQSNTHWMRHIAIVCVIMFAFSFGVCRGPLEGATSAVLMIMYLTIPHLLGYTVLCYAASLVRTLRSYRWLHRHQDAFTPCVATVMPYEVLLLYALWYFRHHMWTCLVLGWANILLCARVIDLVREFDVTRFGSVQWADAQSGKLLPPYLAIILEDAFEKHHMRPDVVSLDLAIDIKCMRIVYSNGKETPLSRAQVIPYGAARRYFYDPHFYAYTIPRLLSLQSPVCIGGAKFRTARAILRILSMTMLLTFGVVVAGMVVQAAFPQLRPLPVRVRAPDDGSFLLFDHIVVRLLLRTEAAQPAEAARAATTWPISERIANSAFKWSNITSADGEDFYPQLCNREYYGTSVLEMALLALAPYLFDIEHFETMLKFMNTRMGSDWVIRPRYGDSCVPGDSNHESTGWLGYFDVYSKQRNLSVITIRGTDLFSFTDFLIDINLYFETVLYQIISTVVPGTVFVPRNLVVELIRMSSIPPRGTTLYETWDQLTHSENRSVRGCQQNNHRRDFFSDVYNHIAYVGLQSDRPKHVVLTGHSLGGAVASIIAAQMDVKAITFNAPGILLARKKFNVNLRSIHKNIIAVVSSDDVVPAIGKHGGEVQHVECLSATRELCHAMESMIGTLWRSCSSLRDRHASIIEVI